MDEKAESLLCLSGYAQDLTAILDLGLRTSPLDCAPAL